MFDPSCNVVGVKDVGDFQFNAGDRVSKVEKFLRLGQIDIRQGRVVFIHAGLENSSHGEGPDLGHHAHRADRPCGRNHADRIAHKGTESKCQFLTENNPWLFRGLPRAVRIIDRGHIHKNRLAQIFQAPGDKIPAQFRDFPFPLWIDASQHDSLSAALGRQHYLLEDKWRGRHDVGNCLYLLCRLVVAAHPVFHAILDDDVGCCSQDLGLDVFLEAGHDAHRTDQSGDAQRDAGYRDERIQRDGAITALGTQVAETDEYFIG